MKVHIITYHPCLSNCPSGFYITTVEEDRVVDTLVRNILLHKTVLVNVVCKNIDNHEFGAQRFPLGVGSQSVYMPGHPDEQMELRYAVAARLNKEDKSTMNQIRAEIEKDVKEKYERKLLKLLKNLSEEQE